MHCILCFKQFKNIFPVVIRYKMCQTHTHTRHMPFRNVYYIVRV